MTSTHDFTTGTQGAGESNFSGKEWNRIEKPLDDFDTNVAKALNGTVDVIMRNRNIENESNDVYKVYGEMLYLYARDFLVKKGQLQQFENLKTEKEKDKKKKKGAELKKADIIRMENSRQTIEKNIQKVLEVINSDRDYIMPSEMSRSARNTLPMELIGIAMIATINYILKNDKKYFSSTTTKTDSGFVLEVLTGGMKFLNSIKNLVGNSFLESKTMDISPTFVNDLSDKLDLLKKKVNFNVVEVNNRAPHLFVWSQFDSIVPNSGFKPYDHQVGILEILHSSLEKCNAGQSHGSVTVVRTPTGSGKTTTCGAIGNLINQFNKYHKLDEKNKKMFICCCSNHEVLIQAGNQLFNAKVPLAKAYINEKGRLAFDYNWNFKREDCCAFICSPNACHKLLEKYQNSILFFDEPTVGADTKTEMAYENVSSIMNIPRDVIFVSATMPDEIPSWILEIYRNRHGVTPNKAILNSDKIHVACELKTFDNKIILPYMKCTNKEELATVIRNIRKNTFLIRQFSSDAVIHMWKNLTKLNVKSLVNVDEEFRKIENFNPNAIKEIALKMLMALMDTDDATIKKFCSEEIKTNDVQLSTPKKKNNIVDGIEFLSEEDEGEGPTLDGKTDFSKLGTYDAFKYPAQGLIAHPNPVQYATQIFSKLIEMTKHEITSTTRFLKNHESAVADWQKCINKLASKIDDEGKVRITSKKKGNSDERITKEDTLRSHDEMKEIRPLLKFPYKVQINTIEHLRYFAKKNSCFDGTVRVGLDAEYILTNCTNVPEDIAILLCCGIGIYSPDLPRSYSSIVMDYAAKGELSFLVSDCSIAYGTNFPFNSVFVTKDFSDMYNSLNTVYQLISRAGRVNRSYRATAYVDSSCAEKILNSTFETDNEYNVEANNMSSIYGELLQEIRRKDEEEIANLEKKRLDDEKRRQDEEKKLQEILEEQRKKQEMENELIKEKTRVELSEKEKLEELRKRRENIGAKTVKLSDVINRSTNKKESSSTGYIAKPFGKFEKNDGNTKKIFGNKMDKIRKMTEK